jgi:hypothetical protein
MMLKGRHCIALVAATLALAGCDAITGLFSGGCKTNLVAAVSVTIVDSIGGGSLTNGATVRVQDGAYADSITVPIDTSSNFAPTIALAWERPGVYQVTVRHAGYRDWNASNVRVTKDECHVHTAVLTARLIRVP